MSRSPGFQTIISEKWRYDVSRISRTYRPTSCACANWTGTKSNTRSALTTSDVPCQRDDTRDDRPTLRAGPRMVICRLGYVHVEHDMRDFAKVSKVSKKCETTPTRGRRKIENDKGQEKK